MKFDWDQRLANEKNCFDVMRLALATLVIFEHSYFLLINSPATEPLFNFSRGQIDFGAMAVDFFFVISGLLIARSWEMTADLGRYLQKRAARIIPGFIISSLVGVLIGALSVRAVGAYFHGINTHVFLANLFTLHQADPPGAFPNKPMAGVVVGTLWSIRYEFDCYLVVALFGMLRWLCRGPITVAFVALFFLRVLQQLTGFELHGWDYGVRAFLISNPNGWPHLFTFFFAGAFFYLWRNYIPRSFAIFLVALVTLIFAIRYGGAEWALLVVGSYCVFFISMSAAVTPRIFGKRVDLSYGLYLFGFPIQQLIIFYFLPRGIDPLLLFAISLPATSVIAYLSWRFIEAPSIRWKWPTISATTLQRSSRIPLTRNAVDAGVSYSHTDRN